MGRASSGNYSDAMQRFKTFSTVLPNTRPSIRSVHLARLIPLNRGISRIETACASVVGGIACLGFNRFHFRNDPLSCSKFLFVRLSAGLRPHTGFLPSLCHVWIVFLHSLVAYWTLVEESLSCFVQYLSQKVWQGRTKRREHRRALVPQDISGRGGLFQTCCFLR